MKYDNKLYINNREISLDSPTYFIADVASNHDGDLERAKQLIWLAKKAGADAVKFQHFKADKIVSDFGFKNLGNQVSHQATWKESVYKVYQKYECNRNWTEELIKTAREAQIDFMTTPYDLEAVRMFNQYLPAYKIGSGDITWTDFIATIAKQNKPVILATGASTMRDVERAVDTIIKHNSQIALLQCNTNYTGSLENFKYINLNVLQTYALRYPNMILGLSDHTPGNVTVLGAITLGARIIEKHFTDDQHREGPDHFFSMTFKTWQEMVERSREIELSLGSGVKKIEDNEMDTIVVQRRCLRLTRNMQKGEKICREDLDILRPSPEGALQPYEIDKVINKNLKVSKTCGDTLYTNELE
ncbi:N-acetylneuraminate synthase family protein [Aphanizomenon flos-aquae]|uniref:N-acetylneuraminate synthase family protein n=1 Tax=Aphanizomenon flos-aquae TaxID=1176 RepID=UPI000481ED30|nr:N-acetylneuraminate synthase family protein [Aphanizomenon flos-aquae]